MNYIIKNTATLKKLLWLDFLLGGSTAVIGLVFFELLTAVLGLTSNLIIFISAITLLYSIVSFTLARQVDVNLFLLRTLIYGNWLWVIVSIVLLSLHFKNATLLGRAFLILQIIVVGALAWLEANQLIRKS